MLTFAVYGICTCWSWNCYCFEDFSHILILPVWISFHERMFPSGIIFLGWVLGWISCPWVGNSQRKTHSYGGFHVYELAIPGRITIYPVEGKCWQPTDKILLVELVISGSGGRVLAVCGRKILRMVTSQGFLTKKDLYRLRNFFLNLN
jgi:hypothetical protein